MTECNLISEKHKLVDYKFRRKFRFELKSKSIPETILLHTAIDRIGQLMFPEIWGCYPSFILHPLFLKRNGNIFGVRCEKGSNAFDVVEYSQEKSANDFAEMYAAVINEITFALKSSELKACIVKDDKIVDLGWVAFYSQKLRVFGIGKVRINKRNFTVRLSRISFSNWLQDRRIRMRLTQSLSNILIKSISDANEMDANRKWNKPRITKIVKKLIFPFRIVKDDIDNFIWSQLDDRIRSNGRPGYVSKKWDADLLVEVRAKLRESQLN